MKCSKDSRKKNTVVQPTFAKMSLSTPQQIRQKSDFWAMINKSSSQQGIMAGAPLWFGAALLSKPRGSKALGLRVVQSCQCRKIDELARFCRWEWSKIYLSYCKSLTSSYRKLLMEVVGDKGGGFMGFFFQPGL